MAEIEGKQKQAKIGSNNQAAVLKTLPEGENNPIVTLETKMGEVNYEMLQAGKNNVTANSGEQMYKDIGRMDFVINGEPVDPNFIYAAIEGSKSIEFNKIWEKISADKKTDEYKGKLKEFYDIGKENAESISNGEYRQFDKELYEKIFTEYGKKDENDKVVMPSGPIIEKLITDCNQAGYESVYSPFVAEFHAKHELLMIVNNSDFNRQVQIDCSNSNSIKVACTVPTMPINFFEKKICDMSFSLTFTLESKDGDSITYKDGELLLTVPRELGNYRANDEEEQLRSDIAVKKNLLDYIIGYFLDFFENFSGKRFINREQVCNIIKSAIMDGFKGNNKDSSVISLAIEDNPEIKIKHNLGDPLSNVEEVKPPENHHLCEATK